MIKQLNINKMKNLICKKMRRIVVLFFVALTLFSCNKEDNSIEGRITRAMKDYARKNFDDPKSLVEIPLIEVDETIDIQKEFSEVLITSAELDSLCTMKLELLTINLQRIKDAINKGELSREDRLDFSDMFKLWTYKTFSALQDKKMRDFYYKEVDSLMNDTIDHPITTYNINVRVKEKDGLKIKHYYTWSCDTTTVFKIYDKPVLKEEFEKEAFLLEESDNLLKYGLKWKEYIEEGEKLCQKYIWLVD